MKNNLGDLNNYLFEQLERLSDDEEMENEENSKKTIERSKAIVDVAKTIIDNAKLALDTMKFQENIGNEVNQVPQMLAIGYKNETTK